MPTLTMRQQRAAASKRRTIKVILAIVGSLLLHLLIVLAVLWIVPHWPRPHYLGKPPPGPLRLEILPPTASTPAPGQATPPPENYIRTTDDQKSDTAPTDPSFTSDKDTQAASEKPAAGDAPVPTQDGRQTKNSFNLDSSHYRPGKTASDSASNAPAPQSQTKTTEAQQETPAPTATPLPTKSRPRRKDTANQPTPAPDGELAMAKAEPTASPEPPAPTPEKPDQETGNTPPRPTRQQSRSPSVVQTNPSLAPNTGQVRTPGYQPETQVTKMVGSINNRGKVAVSAIGTPLGRYKKAIDDAISALWFYRTNEREDVLSTSSDVKFNFHVNRSGKVVGLRVIGGNPNSALSSVTTGAIMDADIPPMPPEVAALLLEGQLEIDFSFGID